MLFSPAYTTLFTDMGWSYLWYFTEVGWTYLIFYSCVNCSCYSHLPTQPSSQTWGGHTSGISQRWGETYLIFYFVLIVHDTLTSPHHPVHKCRVVIPMVFHRGGEDVPGVSLCVNCSWYCHQPTPPSSQTWGGCTWCFILCELFMVLSPANTTQFTDLGWMYPVFHFV